MEKKLNILFLFFYLIIGFIPNFGAADRIAFHWIYLNIISILSLSYFLIYPSNDILKSVIKNKPLLILIIFSIWTFISLFYSININESIISIIRFLSISIAGVFFFKHVEKLENLKSIFIFILLPIFIIELFLPLQKLIEIVQLNDFSFNSSDALETFTPNKNITAAIIAGHTGFIFIMLYYIKKWRVLLLILPTLSAINIFFLSARASIIGIILSLLFVLILTIIQKRENLKVILKVILFVIIGFLASNLYVGNNNDTSLKNRLTTINTEDESTSARLRYYRHGIDHILSNPFIGVGIGNWKQKSIEYDKDFIKSYIVPYHLHNDFLQFGAETGIIGMIIYLLIFLSVLLINIKRFKVNYFLSSSLIIAISVLFMDSNLNFPHARPIMMILLLLIISLTEINRTRIIEK